MKIHVWGTDFRRSPAEMRSKLFVAPENREKVVRDLLSFGFTDLVFLYTCNRVEFYTTAPDHFTDTRHLWLKVLNYFNLSEDDYYRGYHFEGKTALRHLLRVASSLESLVIGEPQILGQLKESLAWTKEKQFPIDPSLERSFHLAFQTAKSVRTVTTIGEKPVSVATLGIKHLQSMEAHYPLSNSVVVGRSPISVLTVQWLLKHRPESKVIWVNRSLPALESYPESKQVELMSLSDFLNVPPAFSHLFTATASTEPIFTARFFERLGGQKKLVFDFAQPPDVEKTEENSRYATIIHMEDLLDEAKENRETRSIAVGDAEKLIDSALKSYCQDQKEAPLLKDFSTIEPLFLEELASAISLLEKEFPVELHPRIKKWAEKLVKKNLHCSREHLRQVLRQVSEPTEQSPFYNVL